MLISKMSNAQLADALLRVNEGKLSPKDAFVVVVAAGRLKESSSDGWPRSQADLDAQVGPRGTDLGEFIGDDFA